MPRGPAPKPLSQIEAGPPLRTIPTGLKSLDALLGNGGFIVPSYGIIGARPNVGKTTFALSVLRRLTYKRALISLEVNEQRAQGLARKVPRLDDSRFFIHDRVRYRDLQDVLDSLESFAAAKFELVFVDHLHLIRVPHCRPFSYEAVSVVAQAVQEWVYCHDVCVVAMAQMGRGVQEAGKYREPCIEDLKGSGELEQCADWVLSLWREDATKTAAPVVDHRLKVEVLKNRYGPCFSKCFLEFDGASANVWETDETHVETLAERRAARAQREAPDESPGVEEAKEWLSEDSGST